MPTPGFSDPGSGSHRAPNSLNGPNGSSPFFPPMEDLSRGPHDTPAAGFPSPFDERSPYGAPRPSGPPQPPPPFGQDGTDTGSGPLPFGPGGSDTGSGPVPFGGQSPFGRDGSDTGSQPMPFGADGSDTGSGPVPFGGDPLFRPDGSQTGSGQRPFGQDGSDTGSQPMPFGPDGSQTGSGQRPFGQDGSDTGSQPMPFGPDGSDTGSGPRPYGTEDFPPGVPRPTGDPIDPFGGPAQGQDGPYGASAGAPPYAGPGPAAPPADSPFPGHQRPAGMPPARPQGAGPGAGGLRMPPAAGERPEQDGEFGGRPPRRSSSETLVSGIPTVPSGARGSDEAPAAAPAKPAAPKPAAAKPVKKGRSKLMLLGVGAGLVVVVAYGAGLLMNHAQVPKGTTVLGVDIGNESRTSAVKTLDNALGNRTTAPLNLTFGSRKQVLKPSIAGLSIDTDATVKKVAHTDYNPFSVIGSLFGGERKADPVILVDEDKLKSALKSVAGANTSGTDGMVRFADGKAVAVPGKPSQTFNVDDAARQVADAYRARAETGVNESVPLNVTTVPPKVTQAELTSAVNGFGRTAMLGPVTVRVDTAHQIAFNTKLPKFLSMRPDSAGHLHPYFDLKALKGLYGGTFDGVLIQRANGAKTAVTPQDVANALLPGLKATKEADRIVGLAHVAKN